MNCTIIIFYVGILGRQFPIFYSKSRELWFDLLLLSTNSHAPCMWGESDVPACGPPASFSVYRPAVQSLRRGLSANPGVTMWCVCGCSGRDDVCRVCECYRGSIVVMDVIWRRLSVNMIWGRVIYLFWDGQECDEWVWKVSIQSC